MPMVVYRKRSNSQETRRLLELIWDELKQLRAETQMYATLVEQFLPEGPAKRSTKPELVVPSKKAS
jgi:hypothetical protein